MKAGASFISFSAVYIFCLLSLFHEFSQRCPIHVGGLVVGQDLPLDSVKALLLRDMDLRLSVCTD